MLLADQRDIFRGKVEVEPPVKKARVSKVDKSCLKEADAAVEGENKAVKINAKQHKAAQSNTNLCKTMLLEGFLYR